MIDFYCFENTSQDADTDSGTEKDTETDFGSEGLTVYP